VIAAANSQPYSHIHQPGIGVGGHCIPVYPHFLLSRASELDLVDRSRRINDGQVEHAIEAIRREIGDLAGAPVLVLGLTYRHGVHELAYSRALPLIAGLASLGAVVSAWDPLLDPDEIARSGASAWTWATPGPFRAIVTQTADPRFLALDPAWFPELELVFDGRDSLRDLALPANVAYRGIGVPGRAAGTAAPEAGLPGPA
jgi:UDP-N-acetyl-D-mannosaminuronic acid dehydrogenase